MDRSPTNRFPAISDNGESRTPERTGAARTAGRRDEPRGPHLVARFWPLRGQNPSDQETPLDIRFSGWAVACGDFGRFAAAADFSDRVRGDLSDDLRSTLTMVPPVWQGRVTAYVATFARSSATIPDPGNCIRSSFPHNHRLPSRGEMISASDTMRCMSELFSSRSSSWRT